MRGYKVWTLIPFGRKGSFPLIIYFIWLVIWKLEIDVRNVFRGKQIKIDVRNVFRGWQIKIDVGKVLKMYVTSLGVSQ